MQTKIIEALSDAGNHGKFMVGRFDGEWAQLSAVGHPEVEALGYSVPVLSRTGWKPEHLLVLDLATGEGAIFRPGGMAAADLNDKHQIWVCPLFQPFLEWLYRQDLSDLEALPALVELTGVPLQLSGYRRRGPLSA